jgi:hypothetical protein
MDIKTIGKVVAGAGAVCGLVVAVKKGFQHASCWYMSRLVKKEIKKRQNENEKNDFVGSCTEAADAAL